MVETRCTWILSQITQNPLRLARNIHIVLRTTQSRFWLAIQAANYRGNYRHSYIKGSLSLEVPSFVLVEFRLEFNVNLPRRKTRFWFINHGSRRSSLLEGGLFSVRYWLRLLYKKISSYSVQDKLKFIENVWKRLTRWAIWLPSVSGKYEFLYRIMPFWGSDVYVSEWLKVPSGMQENCFLRALRNFKFSWGAHPQNPLVKLVQITHVKSWIHPCVE